MSLARQGFVAVDAPDADTPKHAAFRVQRLNAREPVHAHEQQLLDHLFGMAAPARSGQTVDVTRATFAAGHPGFKKAVWDDLRKVGYIDEQRVSARRVLGRAGAVLAVAGGLGAAIAAVFGTTSDLGKTVALVPLGFVGAGGVAVILGAALTPLSERGLAEGVRWARMARGLSATVRSARRPAVDWATVLPIATAFGLGAALARRSSELGVEIPAWFGRRPAERRSDAGADSWLTFLGSSASSSDGSTSGGDGGSSAGANGGGGGGSGAD